MELKLLDVRQVAERLEMSEWSVRDYVRKGELASAPFPGRSLVFLEEHVEAFARRWEGMTTAEVAGMLNVTQGAVSNWIVGDKLPSRKVRGRRRLDFWEVVRFGLRRGLLREDQVQELRVKYDPSYDPAKDDGDGSGLEP